MTVVELIDFLLRRESTHDLALQLAHVHEVRRRRAERVPTAK
jgi:hypothetical protein